MFQPSIHVLHPYTLYETKTLGQTPNKSMGEYCKVSTLKPFSRREARGSHTPLAPGLSLDLSHVLDLRRDTSLRSLRDRAREKSFGRGAAKTCGEWGREALKSALA